MYLDLEGISLATVLNCRVPEDRYYWVDKHVWAREFGGLVEVGITDAAQTLAGKFLVCRIKKPGRELKKGGSGATLESGKWVGAVSTPVSGVIKEVNPEAEKTPILLNQDPYGTWLFRLEPTQWDLEKSDLLIGATAVQAYKAKIEADGIACQEKT